MGAKQNVNLHFCYSTISTRRKNKLNKILLAHFMTRCKSIVLFRTSFKSINAIRCTSQVNEIAISKPSSCFNAILSCCCLFPLALHHNNVMQYNKLTAHRWTRQIVNIHLIIIFQLVCEYLNKSVELDWLV